MEIKIYSLRPPCLAIDSVTNISRPFRLEICLPRVRVIHIIRGPEYNSSLLFRAPLTTVWREVCPYVDTHERCSRPVGVCAFCPGTVTVRDDPGPNLFRAWGRGYGGLRH